MTFCGGCSLTRIVLFVLISAFCSGPGSEVPYRIYVDSGYVFACMTSLAPLCPLVAPFGLMYFVILSPMLRWLMIFAYRPIFDGGGDKWPQLHHIIVTSLVLGQVSRLLLSFKPKRKHLRLLCDRPHGSFVMSLPFQFSDRLLRR